MSATILAIGTARPRSMRQADAAIASRAFSCSDERQARLLATVFQRSEVITRSSVILEEPNGVPIRQSFYPAATAPDDRGPTTRQRMERYAAEAPVLAMQAARGALNDAAVSPASITHLVTVSCTGFSAPGVDLQLISGLGLSPATQRVHVGFMGCHGAINGLRVAQALAESTPGACILLCTVELCSLHFYYGWDLEKVKANALFSDGAAAAVIAPAGMGWQVHATGSLLLPDSREAMGWTIGDHGFEMSLSSEVPDLIRRHLRGWLSEWLGGLGVRIEEVGSWAIHPGGPSIVRGAGEALGLSDSQLAASRAVLAECGNMSSPTVLFIIDRLRRADAPRPCVALAFGPGLVAEAALVV